jgi:transposase
VDELCIVADRGMISAETIRELEHADRGCRYILGARMRAVKEIREQVLADPAPLEKIHGPRRTSADPSPLKVKEVRIADRRYIVCFNEEQAKKDRADREAIVTALEEQLRQGDKSLVGNKGYRKYIRASEPHFEIDREKVEAEARFDGMWVLRTDLELDPAAVALKYKELWQVEDLFRSAKSLLETRPIYHQKDATIRGHVFASFLALVMLKELEHRMEAKGFEFEWARLREDLDDLEEVRLEAVGRDVLVRSAPRGNASRAFQAVGVALGPAMRFVEPEVPEAS